MEIFPPPSSLLEADGLFQASRDNTNGSLGGVFFFSFCIHHSLLGFVFSGVRKRAVSVLRGA